ncbi:MAG: type IX secretion system protein PorQ [Bacteroidales bacterium]|nr:type IX secretion system protein PorQ [Bacteroidales bacterium]
MENFEGYDETDQYTGNFSAAEYAFMLSYAQPLDSNFNGGITVKPIYSQLEKYSSFGLAFDAGVEYESDNNLFTASAVVRNLGTQFVTYTNQNQEPLPLDVLVGVSQKLQYAPFRLHLTLHNMQKFDLTYKKENEEENIFNLLGDGETEAKEKGFTQFRNNAEVFFQKSIRHLIVGVDFTPFKNLYVSAGYNFQRGYELKLEEKTGGAGFSWGFGFKVAKFRVSYGRAIYHVAGASNHFSLTTDLSEFL